MKTIAQIANEIGVSRQAVHKKIKQEPLSTSLQRFTSTKGNTVYIEVDGENLIKSAFIKEETSTLSTNTVNQTSTLSTNTVNQTSTLSTEFIGSLQSQIGFLTEQNQELREQLNKERDHSREQADKLSDLAAQLADLTRNNQILLGAEQSRKTNALIDDFIPDDVFMTKQRNDKPKKRWFWQKS